MAYRNKVIKNPKTGQQIKFLATSKDTNGKLLEMEASFTPFSKEPPPHYHPAQKEEFTVIAGQLYVKVDGQLTVLNPGDKLHIQANTVHSMWNNGDTKTIVNWKVLPALDTEYFLETTTGLASDGKTNEGGIPNILQTAVLSKKFSHVFRLSRPSFLIQNILFSFLKPIALAAGYKEVYGKYLD